MASRASATQPNRYHFHGKLESQADIIAANSYADSTLRFAYFLRRQRGVFLFRDPSERIVFGTCPAHDV